MAQIDASSQRVADIKALIDESAAATEAMRERAAELWAMVSAYWRGATTAILYEFAQ
jgi:hypothetical protein